jgi:hypothetical protein
VEEYPAGLENTNRTLNQEGVMPVPAWTTVFAAAAFLGSGHLFLVVPRLPPGHPLGLPFRQARRSPGTWGKSHRFAGLCLFLSGLFLAVPPLIWGWDRPVQVFLLLVWGMALLPLLTLTVYVYTMLLLLREGPEL